ncbi:hypothetical protein GA0070606_4745 [Micromonospora citrea]|uniref:DMSO/TMAO reductase YedYZ, heme-binding membrane subunit n=2 Tax=Micromonospora citrea TaxID=47855 RepID=A0A1C6VQ26_9ACTN|nr:hypothetical protein GA0070606_4745 [Micromonospora citrea]
MARAQQNSKAATVRTSSTSRGARTRSRSALALLGVSALAAAWAGTMLTGVGPTAYAYGFFFTEFFAGVIALVALSLTVMLGLLATDRLVLLIRHRVLLQSAHRATGVLGVAGLAFHVLTKVATGRAASTDAVVPFVGGRGLYVGLGTVAALLMVSVLWTGVVRARFAGVGPKWLWRTLHSAAYLSWPFAILHGLNAGRPASAWVSLSYLACVLLVVLALLVRLSVSLGRRSRERHQAAALNAALAGGPAEDAPSRALLRGLLRRGAEKQDRRGWAEATAAGTWPASAGRRRDPDRFVVPVGRRRDPDRFVVPVGRRRDPERFVVPVVPEAGTLHEPLRPGRRLAEPAAGRDGARSRRRAVEPATGRRPVEEREPVVARPPGRGLDERERVTARRGTEERERVVARRGVAEERERVVARRGVAEERERVVARRGVAEERERVVARRGVAEERERVVARRGVAEAASTGRRRRSAEDGRRLAEAASVGRYSAPTGGESPEEPWDSPLRWAGSTPVSAGSVSAEPVSAGPVLPGQVSAGPASAGSVFGGSVFAGARGARGRHSVEDEPDVEPDYWRPPARYVPEDVPPPADDTPTLVDLASRRARRAAGEGRAGRRRRATADAVDGAYWAGLRGEAR